MSNLELISNAMPVTPPSRKPFGSKKAFRPILANKMPTPICEYSNITFLIFKLFFLFD